MSKLSQITAESETIEVFGTEIEVQPLKNREFLRIVARADDGSEEEAILTLIETTLKKWDDSITREELMDAPAAVFAKTMNAVESVNGLEDFFSEAAKKEASKKQA